MTRRVHQPHPHSHSSTEDVLGANWPWLPWHCGLLLAQRYTLPYKTTTVGFIFVFSVTSFLKHFHALVLKSDCYGWGN